jgi:hypothetical protein
LIGLKRIMEVAADAGEAIGYRSAIFEFDGAGGNQPSSRSSTPRIEFDSRRP